MSVVVLDTNTNQPLEPQRAPVIGDLVRETRIDGTTNDFTWQGFPEPPNTIRIITVRSFLQRFTLAEREALRNSSDSIVIDLYEGLTLALYVDLDHPDVTSGLAYISGQTTNPTIATPIIATGRVAEITVDGTFDESYY